MKNVGLRCPPRVWEIVGLSPLLVIDHQSTSVTYTCRILQYRILFHYPFCTTIVFELFSHG